MADEKFKKGDLVRVTEKGFECIGFIESYYDDNTFIWIVEDIKGNGAWFSPEYLIKIYYNDR